MNNSTLSLKTQGIPKVTPNIGLICAYRDSYLRIIIDAFSGFNDIYARREQCSITISNHGQDIFAGTAKELATMHG